MFKGAYSKFNDIVQKNKLDVRQAKPVEVQKFSIAGNPINDTDLQKEIDAMMSDSDDSDSDNDSEGGKKEETKKPKKKTVTLPRNLNKGQAIDVTEINLYQVKKDTSYSKHKGFIKSIVSMYTPRYLIVKDGTLYVFEMKIDHEAERHSAKAQLTTKFNSLWYKAK